MNNKGVVVALVIMAGVVGLGAFYAARRKNAVYTTVSTPVTASPTPTPIPTPTAKAEIALTVNSPTSGQTVNTASVQVRGKTVAGATVYVDDQETKADASGGFSVTVKLNEGENVIPVTVVDEGGNSAEQEITINFGTIE